MYGGVLVALSWLIVATAWALGSYILVLALLSGFVFVGPVLAICSYSISRQLERTKHRLSHDAWYQGGAIFPAQWFSRWC